MVILTFSLQCHILYTYNTNKRTENSILINSILRSTYSSQATSTEKCTTPKTTDILIHCHITLKKRTLQWIFINPLNQRRYNVLTSRLGNMFLLCEAPSMDTENTSICIFVMYERWIMYSEMVTLLMSFPYTQTCYIRRLIALSKIALEQKLMWSKSVSYTIQKSISAYSYTPFI